MMGMKIFHLPPLSNSDISVMEVFFVGEHVYVFSCALLSVESDVMGAIINVGCLYK